MYLRTDTPIKTCSRGRPKQKNSSAASDAMGACFIVAVRHKDRPKLYITQCEKTGMHVRHPVESFQKARPTLCAVVDHPISRATKECSTNNTPAGRREAAEPRKSRNYHDR